MRKRPETRASARSRTIRPPLSSLALVDSAPQATNDDGRFDLGNFSSDLALLDRAPGTSGSGRFPRQRDSGSWRKRDDVGSVRTRRHRQAFYPEQRPEPSHRRTTSAKRLVGRTSSRHTEGWARALNAAGIPVCWVCDTRNHASARECLRCGQRLVKSPSADSSVHNVPAFEVESEWSTIHSVCVALSLLIAAGFLLLG